MTAEKSPFDAYVSGIERGAAQQVTALHEAVLAAHGRFDTAVKYGILTYALNEDWRHWVCAIDARKNRVSLRFLYGVLLEDPRRVLRPGTSVLMSWDFSVGEAIDPKAVGGYVKDAVAKYDHYRANDRRILDESRAAAAARRRSRRRLRPSRTD